MRPKFRKLASLAQKSCPFYTSFLMYSLVPNYHHLRKYFMTIQFINYKVSLESLHILIT